MSTLFHGENCRKNNSMVGLGFPPRSNPATETPLCWILGRITVVGKKVTFFCQEVLEKVTSMVKFPGVLSYKTDFLASNSMTS